MVGLPEDESQRDGDVHLLTGLTVHVHSRHASKINRRENQEEREPFEQPEIYAIWREQHQIFEQVEALYAIRPNDPVSLALAVIVRWELRSSALL